MPFRKVLSLAVLLLASAPLALAQGTYALIDYPGAILTATWGIDQAGDVSGYYEDASDVFHGFLLSGGVYTTIDYPGAALTQLFGINNQGSQIVGSTDFQPFIYDIQTQAFTNIGYPGGNSTLPLAINDSGSVVGTFQGKNGTVYGFELVGSNYTRISLPNAGNVMASGITNSNEVVGYANIYGTGTVKNFLVEPREKLGILTTVAGHPEAFGIRPSGSVVVGAYFPVEAAEGFVYRDGGIGSIAFPGAGATWAYGINIAGEVVGIFADQNNNLHGYTWTPPTDAGKR